MEQPVEPQGARRRTSPVRGAGAAAAASALAARVAELETVLAVERAENTRRLREVDGHMRVMRDALRKVQSEFRNLSGERDTLRRGIAERQAALAEAAARIEELERHIEAAAAEREGQAAGVVASAVARAQRAEERLQELLELQTVREQRIRELELGAPGPTGELTRHIVDLEEQLARGREQLQRATEALRGHEERLGESEERAEAARRVVESWREDSVTQPAPAGAPRGASGGAPVELPLVRTGDSDPDVPAHEMTETQAPVELPRPVIDGLRFEQEVAIDEPGRLLHAREIATRRAVAVRLLPLSIAEVDQKRLDALVLARHTNLVSAQSFGVTHAGAHIVVERPVGEPADDWVARIGPLPGRIAIAIALQAARGLRQAAFHGVLHGDLGPASIRVDASGRVQVWGAGIGDLIAPHHRAVTSPAYASPERLRGRAPDALSDLYSLGAVLYFLVTGEPPFAGGADGDTAKRPAGPFPDPREKSEDVSVEVAKLVGALTADDPERRPGGWDEVLLELEGLVPGRTEPEVPSGIGGRLRRLYDERPFLLTALALVPFVLAALVFQWSSSSGLTVRERYEAAARRAAALVERGDIEGARRLYGRFSTGTGDASVEREALLRLEDLAPR